MAMVPEASLFCWKDIENLGDPERLGLVLRTIPDERLMREDLARKWLESA